MTSPFDYAKSVTHTKESLYDNELLFNKEYLPFMVNRSLSNSPQTALFADVMNQFSSMDKKIQYDFYLFGIPKQKGYSKWAKKEDSGIDSDIITLISESLNVSVKRAIELFELIGIEACQKEIAKRGGKK